MNTPFPIIKSNQCPICLDKMNKKRKHTCLCGLSCHKKCIACFSSCPMCKRESKINDNIDILQNRIKALNTGFDACPDCGIWIEKISGCSDMRCICGNQFKYRCQCRGRYCSCDTGEYINTLPVMAMLFAITIMISICQSMIAWK